LQAPASDQEIHDWLASMPDNSAATPETIAARREILQQVAPEITRSPVGSRRWLQDLSEEQVAEELGMTRDQVAGKLKRLRARLRERAKD
jgi:hypothetical protein